MNNTCQICECKYTASTRVKITCENIKCVQDCCKKCFVKFIESKDMSPSCMFCHAKTSSEFVRSHLSVGMFREVQRAQVKKQIETAFSRLPFLQEEARAMMYEDSRTKFLSDGIDAMKEKWTRTGHESILALVSLNKDYLGIVRSSTKKYNVFDKTSYRIGSLTKNISVDSNRMCNFCGIIMPSKSILGIGACNNNECLVKTCLSCARLMHAVNEGKCVCCDEPIDVLNFEFGTNIIVKPYNAEPLIEAVDLMIRRRNIILNIIPNAMDYYYGVKEIIRESDRRFPILDNTLADDKTKTFVKKCLSVEGECRGFLSRSFKCGMCKKQFCKHCQIESDDEHECNPDDVATIKHLLEETKPCPKCSMPISRISGCNQVWTPCCKIAFDWSTGKIDSGNIHCPEYFDYLRRNNMTIARNPNDINGLIADKIRLVSKVRYEKEQEMSNWYTNFISIITRKCHHIIGHTLVELLPQRTNEDDYGVRFLAGRLTLEKWKQDVLTLARKNDRHELITITLRKMVESSVEVMLMTMCNDEDPTKCIKDIYAVCEKAQIDVNKIYKMYGIPTPISLKSIGTFFGIFKSGGV